ncbi:MAG TPA: cell filamentation protein Fic [Porphyromonadaceae bacterium]|nr:cell filamentation protein Fic [Porphyromonadaceae bacterium]
MNRKDIILSWLKENPGRASSEILKGSGLAISLSTLKRDLSDLAKDNYLVTEGRGKASKYFISSTYTLFYPVDVDQYFEKEIDERNIHENYNFELIELLNHVSIFSDEELRRLNSLQKKFSDNIAELPEELYIRDMERLAIDLSWKSSQIEGNTYTLLETEQLIKEKKTASGKSKDEAVMLLNHKEAIDFIIDNSDYLSTLSVGKIENIHSILIKELNVDRNLRTRRVGITGTNYKPLDNEFQIREALEDVCKLVNNRENIFEKAFLLLVMISYIQPFNDGNKRTARILSNAQLIAGGYCPISFRTVDSVDYKKAMLLFYEQNNMTAFKNIFIDQFEFAVNTYF